jgi:2-keto-4-pentenoate hydratase/2-oxohepta-3-ene-1,7-dioic acid hydratase in catechol pathway
MKLVTYDSGSGPAAGVLVDDGVVDVASLLGGSAPLRDVQALLELPNEPLNRLRDQLAKGAARSVPLQTVRLRAPVLRPPTVRDFMIYEGHASGGGTRKLADAWYRMPIFYFSNTLRISGPEDEVPVPSASDRLDYELELGCVIGREGTNVRAADGLDYIAGFTIFNDWSARDLQFDEMECRLGPAKGKDAATTLGPWVVTADEMAPYLRDGRLHVSCSVRVNGQPWMENGEGGQMYHTWGDLVERASRDSRIVPGDVFGTGTVSGGTVGEAMQRGYPARYLQPGDLVELEVEGIGVLRNKLGPKVDADPTYRYGPPAAVTTPA